MVLDSIFGNPVGLLSLLALIPFIILYFIRPKAKDLTIPSLMFLVKKGGKQEKSSFLRNFLRDLLFIIQLLLLLFLAFSIADPFIKTPGISRADTVVIVMDVSASMAAEDVWDDALDAAFKYLGRKNSIVLTGQHSLIALEGGSASDAKAVLKSIKPGISPSNIADGISTARSLLDQGDIVVVSDLRQTTSGDILAAKVAAEADGLGVHIVDVGKDYDNLAIVDVQVTTTTSKIYIKNYFDTTKTVKVLVHDTEHQVTIPANSVEILAIETPEGITKISLVEDDALALDNVAYIATPEKQKVKVLFITERESSFLQLGLQASPTVDLELAHPPIVPDTDADFIVFQDVDTNKLLAGTMALIEEKVKAGTNVIFAHPSKEYSVYATELIPVEFKEKITNESIVVTAVINSITKGKEFGTVNNYYATEPKAGALVLAHTQSGVPLLVLREVGAGKTFYFGIPDDASDFKYSPSFPLFWNDLLDFMQKHEDYANYNYKGGTLQSFNDLITVKKPSGVVKTNALVFDELGVYDLEGRRVVANLIDRKESDLKGEKLGGVATTIGAGSGSLSEGTVVTTTVPRYLATILILAVLALLLFEVYYVKQRGEF